MTMAASQPQQSSIWWFFLLEGMAGIILGLLLITDPGATIVALVTFLGFYWLIMGILALVRIFIDRSVPWIWSLLIGIIGIFTGGGIGSFLMGVLYVLVGLLLLGSPIAAALAVPLVFGVLLLVQGVALVV